MWWWWWWWWFGRLDGMRDRAGKARIASACRGRQELDCLLPKKKPPLSATYIRLSSLLLSSSTRKRFLPSATFWTGRGHRSLAIPSMFLKKRGCQFYRRLIALGEGQVGPTCLLILTRRA